MSNIILGGGPSGSGSVTLQAPNTNSNQTVNIPDRTGNVMMDGPAFSVYHNTTQNITASTWTKVPFNTKEFDTASCFDNVTNYRFTPNVAGYYQINACVYEYGSAQPTRAVIAIWKNGSEYKRGNDFQIGTGGYIVSTTINSLVYMNGSTDYLEIYVSIAIASGTAQIYGSTTAHTYFNGVLMRAA